MERNGFFTRDGPWHDPTRSYFWPALNKSPTSFWPGYFLTQPEEIFWPNGKKIKKFDVFRGSFPNLNPNHRWLTQPEPLKIDPTRLIDVDSTQGSQQLELIYGSIPFLSRNLLSTFDSQALLFSALLSHISIKLRSACP